MCFGVGVRSTRWAPVRRRLVVLVPSMTDRQARILTFLFTDIEGSTRRWETDPAAMAVVVRRHDDLLGAAIARHDGALVKQTGDGVFAAFVDPGQAVRAAIETQEAFSAKDWASFGPLPVRMGLHSGTAIARADDYFGTEVNRAARLMGVAHGGQILLSAVTAELTSHSLPEETSLDNLGVHRLRDLSEPITVFQLETPRLSRDFPPLRSVDGYPNNLPAAVSSFVGRASDIASTVDQLETTRLLSLTGAGGSGKTRLALQVAAELLPRFADGIWFIDLAGLSEPGLVPQQVATTLHIPEKAGRAWIDVLVEYVAQRSLLLVLDNCEHLLESVASVVDVLLQAAPDLKVLTTTREPLNLSGEVARRVPTMQIPTEVDGLTLDELLGYEAVQLFVVRALAARNDLEFSNADSSAIAEICRRLDGLPLALELAAARVRALSVAEIASNLGDRFALLSGGSRTALPRHRTLEGTVAWSYELLGIDEQELFQLLTVFNGGFDLEAALEVAGSGSLNGVASLVDKSLLSATTTAGSTRYRMLETVAAFGHQKLGQAFAPARDAHLQWATGLSKSAAAELEGPNQTEWLGRIAGELDNLRAAMQWALDGGDPLRGMIIAGSLYRFWYIRAVGEGRRWLDLFLDAAPPAPPELQARALFAAGSLTQAQGDYAKAAVLLQESLGIFSELGERRGGAYALHYLLRARWGPVPAHELRDMINTDVAEFREIGDPAGLALTLLFDVLWHAQYGSVDDAEAAVTEMVALTESIGAPQLVAHGAEISAVVNWLKDDLGPAAASLGQAAGIYLEIGNQQCAAHCLENAAAWAQRSGRAMDAATLLGSSTALRLDTGIPTPDYETFLFDQIVVAARDELGDSFADAWDRGLELSMQQALDFVQEITSSTA